MQLKQNKLLLLSFLACLVMLLITAFKGHSHFTLFTAAASRLFLLHENPYNRAMDPNGYYQSLWLYSPTGALFFLPFSMLPKFLGVLLYIGGSFVLFATGLRKYLSSFHSDVKIPGLLFVVILSETLGAIQATKFELLTTGLLLWVFVWLNSNRSNAAVLLLGLLSSIKFQTLPILGLVSIHFLLRRDWRRPTLMLATLGLSFAWPWLVWPADFVLQMHHEWFSTLSKSAEINWAAGQSFPVFLNHLVGSRMDYADFTRASLIYASLCGFLVAVFSSKLDTDSRRLNLCLCLGVSYTVLFSPLSQSSSYVLITPLVITFYGMLKGSQRTVWFFLMIHWLMTSLLYSDLVPKSVRSLAWQFNVKPIGTAVLVGGLMFLAFLSSAKFFRTKLSTG